MHYSLKVLCLALMKAGQAVVARLGRDLKVHYSTIIKMSPEVRWYVKTEENHSYLYYEDPGYEGKLYVSMEWTTSVEWWGPFVFIHGWEPEGSPRVWLFHVDNEDRTLPDRFHKHQEETMRDFEDQVLTEVGSDKGE